MSPMSLDKNKELFSVVEKSSENIENENLQKLKKVFPQFVKDGEVDFDAMQAFLKKEGVLAGDEKYGLNWSGKSNAFKAIRTPATGTLIPEKNKSKNFDETENIFIEGDNLEVLKLLQKHYREKIKMIYIDPPYNTGKDFVYRDNLIENINDYKENLGITKDGTVMKSTKIINGRKNSLTDGRYHSDWLTMMYPRLFLGRNLLNKNGVIFVSIDDHEIANLRLLMDEIFGPENFVGEIIRVTNKSGTANDFIRKMNDYVLVYSKDINYFESGGIEGDLEVLDKEDKFGKYRKGRELNKWGTDSRREDSPSMWYPIIGPNGEDVYPIKTDGTEGRWRLGKVTMSELIKKDGVIFEKNDSNVYRVYEKVRVEGKVLKQFKNIFDDSKYLNAAGSQALKRIFSTEMALFDFSKPVDLIKDLILFGANDKNDIVLDFFAGSGTTAQAVMELNNEDQGTRKSICVQLPEVIEDMDSEAYKSGYKTISEISRERIRRAGDKIGKGDIGFKSYKLSNSNYRKWSDMSLDDEKELIKQSKLFIESPLIDDFVPENIVYEIALKEGFDLNSKVTQDKGNLKPYILKDGDRRLFVTFSDKVTKEKVEDLKLSQDDLFVCFDNAMSDTEKVNVGRIINLKVI
jgi:adenine-specific DNA-methyltransferase